MVEGINTTDSFYRVGAYIDDVSTIQQYQTSTTTLPSTTAVDPRETLFQDSLISMLNNPSPANALLVNMTLNNYTNMISLDSSISRVETDRITDSVRSMKN